MNTSELIVFLEKVLLEKGDIPVKAITPYSEEFKELTNPRVIYEGFDAIVRLS